MQISVAKKNMFLGGLLLITAAGVSAQYFNPQLTTVFWGVLFGISVAMGVAAMLYAPPTVHLPEIPSQNWLKSGGELPMEPTIPSSTLYLWIALIRVGGIGLAIYYFLQILHPDMMMHADWPLWLAAVHMFREAAICVGLVLLTWRLYQVTYTRQVEQGDVCWLEGGKVVQAGEIVEVRANETVNLWPLNFCVPVNIERSPMPHVDRIEVALFASIKLEKYPTEKSQWQDWEILPERISKILMNHLHTELKQVKLETIEEQKKKLGDSFVVMDFQFRWESALDPMHLTIHRKVE